MVKKTAILAKDDEKSAGKTVLRPCSCFHPFQQERYGANRVHNVGKGKIHCTVCGSEKIK
jgi:hypothetical protein